MHAGGARLDHGFHELEGVEHTAETSFSVGHDGQVPIDAVVAFGMVDLVGASKSVVDVAHHRGHAVGGVEALIRIHGAGVVGVGRHLPAAQIDGLESRLGHLHGLIAGQGPQGVDIGLFAQHLPEPFRTTPSQGVLDGQRAP